LAAAVAMIQADLLLATYGKTNDSFAMMDVMRLPLGILSGIGFIGAGTILKRDQLVTGVTTAATLWFVTVIGLCFGGGQIGLGLVATLMGAAILWWLEYAEVRMRQERLGMLHLVVRHEPGQRHELDRSSPAFGLRVVSWAEGSGSEVRISCEIRWQARQGESGMPEFARQIAERSDVVEFQWQEVMRRTG